MALHEAAIQAARRRIEAARHVLTAKQRTQKLRDIGRDRQDAISVEEVGEAQARAREFEAMLLAEIARLNDLKQQDPQLQIARAKAEVSAAQARLEQAQQALDECTIRAPQRGVVLRILLSPGDLISDLHRPAIQFCPETPQIVRAEVDQEFADKLELGQVAAIEDDVNPSQTWKGEVRRISNWYTQRRSVVDDPAKLKDVRTLECIIGLAPDQPPLKIGQRVRVKLHEPRVETASLETADFQTGPGAEEFQDLEVHREAPDASICNG
jgi:HlyD family secretion protein